MPVVSVTQDQIVDAAGSIEDVYTITFTIVDHPGSFVVTVPTAGDPVGAAQAAINAIVSQVGGVYNISV